MQEARGTGKSMQEKQTPSFWAVKASKAPASSVLGTIHFDHKKESTETGSPYRGDILLWREPSRERKKFLVK